MRNPILVVPALLALSAAHTFGQGSFSQRLDGALAFYNVVPLADSGALITTRSYSAAGDRAICRISSEGQFIWARIIHEDQGGSQFYIRKAIELQNGDLCFLLMDPDPVYPFLDIYCTLLVTDPNGDHVWSKRVDLGGPLSSSASGGYDLHQRANGNLVLLMNNVYDHNVIMELEADGTPMWCMDHGLALHTRELLWAPDGFGYGLGSNVLFKVDDAGNILWQKTIAYAPYTGSAKELVWVNGSLAFITTVPHSDGHWFPVITVVDTSGNVTAARSFDIVDGDASGEQLTTDGASLIATWYSAPFSGSPDVPTMLLVTDVPLAAFTLKYSTGIPDQVEPEFGPGGLFLLSTNHSSASYLIRTPVGGVTPPCFESMPVTSAVHSVAVSPVVPGTAVPMTFATTAYPIVLIDTAVTSTSLCEAVISVPEVQIADWGLSPAIADDRLNFQAPMGGGMFHLSMFDAKGRFVGSFKCGGNCSIDIAALVPGMYTMTLRDTSGRTDSRRFVVMR